VLLAAAQAHHRPPAHGLARQHLFFGREGRKPGIEPGSRPVARLRRAASRGLDARGLPLTLNQAHGLRKDWDRPALGCVGDGEERSPGVGARTRALRQLTRRNCPNATSAASAVSFAARPQGEYRSAPCAAGRRLRSPAPAGRNPCIRHTTSKALAFADRRQLTQRAVSEPSKARLSHLISNRSSCAPACAAAAWLLRPAHRSTRPAGLHPCRSASTFRVARHARLATAGRSGA
jgi:hypothetical protein